MLQQGDDPPVLLVGTEVSAKYKGAFCEAKIRKVVRSVKCRVVYKAGGGPNIISDEQIVEGELRVGETVQVKLPDKKDPVTATIAKIQDGSHYTVVFDDGDITTLRRSALCLKSGRHFNASETLDQLPLTHPEHFGNPVMGGRRGRRHQEESSDEDADEDEQPVKAEKEENIGKVVCVESTETKKKSQKENWFPGLVVAPTAQDTVRIRVKDEYLVRSFKDGRYYTVPKKEATEFTRDQAKKHMTTAVQAALEYLDKEALPPHWDRDVLFGLSVSCSECEVDLESDSSDDEPREEKDHFVAQLYKYMDDRGTPLNKGPQISNRDIDLYRLFRAAQKLGGYNRVTSQNQWKAIAVRLGFSPATNSITNLVKQAYKKFLQPFEDFNRKLGCTMVAHPRANRIKGRSLVRASSVASPKPSGSGESGEKERKETGKSVTPVAGGSGAGNEDYENTSESSAEQTPTPVEKPTPVVTSSGRAGKKPRKLSMSGTTPTQQTASERKSAAGRQREDPEDNEPIVQPTVVVVRNKPGPKPKNQQPPPQQEKEKEELATTATAVPGGALGKRQTAVKQQSEAIADNSTSLSIATPVRTPKGRGVSESSATVTPASSAGPGSATAGGSVGKGRKKKEVVVPVPTVEKEEKIEAKGAVEKVVEERKEPESGGGGGAGGPSTGGSGNGSGPSEKGGTIVAAGSSSSASVDDFPVEVGDKLMVFYHERTHEKKYEAKVLEMTADLFLVHYTGWNTRYDEWVPKSRIAENLTSKQKRTKAGVIVKSSSTSSTPAVLHGKIGSGASKRGRGGSRSDSLPPRSTTPCSVTSNSSRTKSPATPAQRRTTRGQPSTLRRTSNNTDISSMQTDSDTDSDEPVKKSTRSASWALPQGPVLLDGMRTDSKDANWSNNEELPEFLNMESSIFIGSDLKEVLKYPSPDAEQSPTSSVHLDHKTSLFHLSDSNTDSNEQKPSKESGSSSDTQSFDEEDSQGFTTTTATASKKSTTVTATPSSSTVATPPTGKGGRGRKEVGVRKGTTTSTEKDSEKSLSKILGTDAHHLDKVEVALVDVGKRGLGGVKGTAFSLIDSGKATEKLSATGRKTTGEKISLGVAGSIKQEKLTASGKTPAEGGVKKEEREGRGKREESSASLSSSSLLDSSDVYEFKEPEPFEFEAAATTSRKQAVVVVSGGGGAEGVGDVKVAGKGGGGAGKKRVLEMEQQTATMGKGGNVASNNSPQTAMGKGKVRRSPAKGGGVIVSTEKLIKKEEKEEGEETEEREEKLSTRKNDPFDVLRKSPNFNVPPREGAEKLLEFSGQKFASTDGFPSPISTTPVSTAIATTATISFAGNQSLQNSNLQSKVAQSSTSSSASSSSVISSAFVNTQRNSDDDVGQWQSLRMFKSAVEGQIDMEDVLVKTRVPKDLGQSGGSVQKIGGVVGGGLGGAGGSGGGIGGVGSGGEFEIKSETRSSIADKFLKTLSHGVGGNLTGGGGSMSNASSPTSSSSSCSANEGGGGAGGANGGKSSSIFACRDFAEKLEPKLMVKKLELGGGGKGVVAVGSGVGGGVVGVGKVGNNSPDKLELELNAPSKNNVLSETIQKLKSAINESEEVVGKGKKGERKVGGGDDEGEGGGVELGESESTDSERERLVIEDDDDDEEEEEDDEEDEDEDDNEEEEQRRKSKMALNLEESKKQKDAAIVLMNIPGAATGVAVSTAVTVIGATTISTATTTKAHEVTAAATAAIATGVPVKIKEELTISSVTLKEQSMSFASKFQESFYAAAASGVGGGTVVATAGRSGGGGGAAIKLESEMDLTCKESFDDACEVDKKDVSITLVPASSGGGVGAAGGSALESINVARRLLANSLAGGGGDGNKDPDSLSLLLCEETIPTSPWHRSMSDKSGMDEQQQQAAQRKAESRLLAGVKSLGQTPNSSPRDSQSPDDSKSDSEDLVKKESEDTTSAKKRRRGVGGRRSPDLDTSTGKRRKLASTRKGSATNSTGGGGNGGSDSEENSDPLSATRQQLLRRSPKPCQFNFLVQLDPSLSSHQKIAILEKKIQDLRKTFNIIKSDLASIDRRRKKLRRRGRETKKQQMQKTAMVVN